VGVGIPSFKVSLGSGNNTLHGINQGRRQTQIAPTPPPRSQSTETRQAPRQSESPATPRRERGVELPAVQITSRVPTQTNFDSMQDLRSYIESNPNRRIGRVTVQSENGHISFDARDFRNRVRREMRRSESSSEGQQERSEGQRERSEGQQERSEGQQRR
jgi:hypothetical protein